MGENYTMYDPALSTIISKVFSRLHNEALEAGPTLGERINKWIHDVYQTDQPQDAFLNPEAFPILLLPWYAEASLHPESDHAFQSDM